MPVHVVSAASRAVTWVSAKTKTRSKNSSRGVTASPDRAGRGSSTGPISAMTCRLGCREAGSQNPRMRGSRALTRQLPPATSFLPSQALGCRTMRRVRVGLGQDGSTGAARS